MEMDQCKKISLGELIGHKTVSYPFSSVSSQAITPMREKQFSISVLYVAFLSGMQSVKAKPAATYNSSEGNGFVTGIIYLQPKRIFFMCHFRVFAFFLFLYSVINDIIKKLSY